MNFLNGLILIIPRYQNIFMMTFLIPKNPGSQLGQKSGEEIPNCPKLAKMRAVYMYIHMKSLKVSFSL